MFGGEIKPIHPITIATIAMPISIIIWKRETLAKYECILLLFVWNDLDLIINPKLTHNITIQNTKISQKSTDLKRFKNSVMTVIKKPQIREAYIKEVRQQETCWNF